MKSPVIHKANDAFMFFPNPLPVFIIAIILPAIFACRGVKCSGETAAETAMPGAVASNVLSEESLSYARSLGGSPHPGETLSLIVGAMVADEAEAQVLLEHALPLFGDMQPYFIVQKSDAFEGLVPGKWIIMEAYREHPSEENIQFAMRAFPDAVIKKAVARNEDPIPVYEDMTGE
jgi:hypothetical protein